jgi:hypothetical protein
MPIDKGVQLAQAVRHSHLSTAEAVQVAENYIAQAETIRRLRIAIREMAWSNNLEWITMRGKQALAVIDQPASPAPAEREFSVAWKDLPITAATQAWSSEERVDHFVAEQPKDRRKIWRVKGTKAGPWTELEAADALEAIFLSDKCPNGSGCGCAVCIARDALGAK